MEQDHTQEKKIRDDKSKRKRKTKQNIAHKKGKRNSAW